MRFRSLMTPIAATLLAAAPLCAQNSAAQANTTPEAKPAAAPQQDDARNHVNRLLEGITLTAQQRQRVDSAVTRFASNTQAPVQPTEEPQDTAKRMPGDTLRTSTMGGMSDYTALDAQVRSLLTPEQQRIWDRNLGTMRNSGRPNRE